MIIYVAFKFDDVDASSERANKIVAEITEACEFMRIGVNADECWLDEAITKIEV